MFYTAGVAVNNKTSKTIVVLAVCSLRGTYMSEFAGAGVASWVLRA